jgi:hypothetical protein
MKSDENLKVLSGRGKVIYEIFEKKCVTTTKKSWETEYILLVFFSYFLDSFRFFFYNLFYITIKKNTVLNISH